jgi:F0F1-type ATP synthase epsilon subunit
MPIRVEVVSQDRMVYEGDADIVVLPENVAEIDVARAEAARQRAEEMLRSGPPPDTDAYLAMEAALRRSNLRLEAARRYRGSQSRTYEGESR